jgi:hypothetical protein
MLKKLLERLRALEEAADRIRAKASAKTAGHLDGLAVAECLVFIDRTAKKLADLADGLQAGLFPNDGSAE